MTPCTPLVRRLRIGAAVAALVAPVLACLAADSALSAASATAPAASASLDPAQRYITALVNRKEVRKGKSVTIHGVVDAPGAPACATGVSLNVERSTRGAIYKVIGTVTTDGAGGYSVKEKVTKKSRFRISAPATDACSSLQSPPRTVKVIG